MIQVFVAIYRYLKKHQIVTWGSLCIITMSLVVLSTQIRLDENISSFFPSQNEETDFVMKNMKAMDKIVMAIGDNEDFYTIEDAAEAMADTLQTTIGEQVDISLYFDEESETELLDYVYSNLPLLLTPNDYSTIDSLTTDEAITAKIKEDKELLMSPLSTGISKILPNDPLGISYTALQKLESLKPDTKLTMRDGYMTSDNKLVMFISMHDDFANTGDNARVVSSIKNATQHIETSFGVKVWAFGAPIVAVTNSEQVKSDETITVSIALIITAIAIWLIFKRKRAILLIILPVIFGALFATGVVSACRLELSLISIGTGAMVLGLAMSYSIHMLTHSLHTIDTETLVKEMAYPMTVGSITTIGAFVGLMFTDSKILQDLGLFASLALVGTLLFCLIYMPHFMKEDGGTAKSAAFRIIEKASSYDYSKNKWIVGVLAILTIVGLFNFNDVQFNADMNSLNYQGDAWVEASKTEIENLLTPDDTLHHATLVVTGKDINTLAHNGKVLTDKAETTNGIMQYSTMAPWFLQTDSMQQAKIEQWNKYWSNGKRERVLSTIAKAGHENGFSDEAFSNFADIINKEYTVAQPTLEDIKASNVFGEWISEKNGTMMLYVDMKIDNNTKDNIFDELADTQGTVIADMGYFVRKATSKIVDNFNFILMVSSVLVGLVLLLSYGRFELFAMTFMPMCISWIIILGMMAIFGIEFNVVNIILSTFIFGVGDDFSIFIMDGLLAKYKDGKDILASHKTAIALSGFAIIVGLGVQVFAEHPACKSIGYLSIFGLVAVLLTSYIVQPAIFRILISNAAENGQPYTIKKILVGAFYYGTFILACLVGYIVLAIVMLMPIKKRLKKSAMHHFIYGFMRFFFWLIGLTFPIKRIGNLDLSKPCVIIANHSSFIDTINVLSLSPNIVCVVKSWVANSPLFGPLTRYCDFYNISGGSSDMTSLMKQCINDGYSIVIFPEGTRSHDGKINRFHKGAFLLAEELGLDIQPIVIYGSNMVASTSQPLNLKDGWIVNKHLDRISADSDKYGTNYVEKTKNICSMMRQELENVKEEYDTADNPYYHEAIRHQYTYKDLKKEWEVRKESKVNRTFVEEEIEKYGLRS